MKGAKPRNRVSDSLVREEDLSHPDEERQRRQRPGRLLAPDGHRHGVADRRRGEERHAQDRGAQQSRADPDAGPEQNEERAQEDDDGEGLGHISLGPSSSRLLGSTES